MAGFSEAKKETQHNFTSYITAYALSLHFQNTCLNAALGNGRIYCVGHTEHTNTHCDKVAQLLNIKVGTCVVTTALSRIKCYFLSFVVRLLAQKTTHTARQHYCTKSHTKSNNVIIRPTNQIRDKYQLQL